MITKLLVANRGEIAIRAFRAAYELGIATVAVYTWEDRNSLHRLKADEAYEIGSRGNPVRAYLDPDAIVATAQACGADAIYPGYGFLSENPALADACTAAGITFVGPPAAVLRLTGNKMRARAAADAAGLPVLAQSGAVGPDDATAAAEVLGYPLFVKAAAGGGGRGLRLVREPAQLRAAVDAAIREAASAFGDATVFLETAVPDPRHIEVQLLGDAGGGVVHLFERDCSVQRRHQKVVEIAPAPNLDRELRDRMCDDAVRFAREIGYVNAGTVEYLVDAAGNYRFIEMNPRIQVEHTVTEETTDVDLVQAQLRIAAGETLADIGLDQAHIFQRGAALQCRITTEDPANDFRPDTGTIVAYRQPGGAGIRLDGGTGYAGAVISPYFDSLLVKLTCRGATFADATVRAHRALAEFRVRGLNTNLAFLQAVLSDADFRAGRLTTSFIDERPDLVRTPAGSDRATRLLRYLADVTVNRPYGPAPSTVEPTDKLPVRPDSPPPAASRDRLVAVGPERFAAELRAQDRLAVSDTTYRDAHQSILATRMRTIDIVAGARQAAFVLPQLLSLEVWGGATFDVALRFLQENPWERLERLREAAPNLCLQMLLRGRNTVGYSPYPDLVAERFVAAAHRSGVDVFRIFDALNDIEQMRPAIAAALEVGALVEGSLCYTSDLSDPSEHTYTLDYYLRIAEALVDSGVHVLCIKDMAGLLRAPAARTLVAALRERFAPPVHLHTHDTAGGQLATYLAAIEAGVDAVDGAAAPLSGMTSQPSLAAIVAATDHTRRATGISLDALADLEPYWEAVRMLYRPFEAGLAAPTGAVYRHEIPGGQLSNLRQQAVALGLGDRFEDVERLYRDANRALGNPVKVTPTSKVVGDLALHLVASGVTAEQLIDDPASVDLPDSVVEYLHGELGTPAGGFPEPFRRLALAGRAPARDRATLAEADRAELDGDDPRPTLNRLLFPGPAAAQLAHRDEFGDVSRLPTRLFWYGLEDTDSDVAVGLDRGVRLLVGLEAIGEPDDRAMRRVVLRLNGQMRPIDVVDRSVQSGSVVAEKADPAQRGQVPAPFKGVVSAKVGVGASVDAGDQVAVIEAMKMESTIGAPIAGRVSRVVTAAPTAVEAGDLVLVIDPG
ncbi:MAG: pyruvate carboxylase [Acidimicrobiia bacterium]|nr:pyruvate carboxylase [Acidimicrobiia bacterium]